MKKKKIEKERKPIFRLYAPVIKAVFILIILVGLLVGVIMFRPEKKEEIKDPSILETKEKNLNNNDATCDGKEAPKIREEAMKVDIAYEVVDDYFFGYMAETDYDINGNGVLDEDPVVENLDYALKIKMHNLTDNIYVVITNDLDEDIKSFDKSNADDNGVVSWFESETTFIRTYDVKVYSSKDGCRTQLYREFNVSLPRFNVLHRSLDCEFEPGKDLEVCQPFTFKNQTASEDAVEFRRAIREAAIKQNKKDNNQEEEKEEKKDIKEQAIEYGKKYYMYIIPGVIILVIILVIVVKRVKKHEK